MALNSSIDSNFNQLTAGTGIGLSNVSGNVTISTTGSAALLPANLLSSGITLASNNYYLVTASSSINPILPAYANSATFDVIEVETGPRAILGNINAPGVNILPPAGGSLYYMGKPVVSLNLYSGTFIRMRCILHSAGVVYWVVSYAFSGDTFSALVESGVIGVTT